MEHRNIAFIGAGNMAHAIIAGLVNGGYPAKNITVSSPSEVRREPLEKEFAIQSTCDNISAVENADVIVLAVKPQMMAEVCKPLQHIDFGQKLVLTIAAGIPASRYNDYLATSLRLIRIMPNTPALVGKGLSGMFAQNTITPEDKQFADALMKSVGTTVWVEQESAINDIIAVAGSAPAYFFLFMESMQQEAERLGFSADVARAIVQQAASGSTALAEKQNSLPFSTLREQVTSKGGTTAAALAQFYAGKLPENVALAMQAAIKRAQEMEKQF
ncbi:pyrroline-5-carboxylate reductase [Proteus mirabilis]|uniref:Pyrroline-5-carboxylate reductase n=1 Tax=Proteus mirabilis TaxID=584 RepID=A0A379FHU8_PROMI|nr:MULTISPECIES: pyrroline-5-carboxylate reductase [Proteus]MJC97564.1 pyrroline-5-carboxylate reductase [Salmonella enterica subsp. enterica serovar Infantis]ARX08515.1 pyrroline-5-carboxylate reductase [Proteus mirabilis]EEI46989.1 pyrroline-5-carboxylate reductase [Proteus mirabilis ATCC 29906]EHZ8013963.1 pyrroline-5-carboxylate reductase [Proteus mirabilis]EKU5731933.1 pyrroline-5-carboxylate reductase [Proteus mirabilis]